MQILFKACFYAGILVAALLVFPALPSAAQDNESSVITIQLRPRAELRNGLFTPLLKDQPAAFFISQRSSIGILYPAGKKLKVGVTSRIVNIWGNDPQVQAAGNSFVLYEAWAQLAFDSSSSLKIGRQTLSYDDERILGKLDWNQAGRKHDAVLFQHRKNKFSLDIAAAFNQNSEKNSGTFFDNSMSQPYKAMELVWAKYNFDNHFSASALLLSLQNQARSDSAVSNLQTAGGNLFYKNEKLSVTASAYYQFGKTPVANAPKIATDAWMASVKASFKASGGVKLTAGSDYLSGKDMNSSSSAITSFNPLFGTHHLFYGFMDYFYVSSPHHNTGLWDSYAGVDMNLSSKVLASVALHHFDAAARVTGYDGKEASRSLGNEADITFSYRMMKEVVLTGGYSQMFAGKSMKFVKDIRPGSELKSVQNWVWLSINITPEWVIPKR